MVKLVLALSFSGFFLFAVWSLQAVFPELDLFVKTQKYVKTRKSRAIRQSPGLLVRELIEALSPIISNRSFALKLQDSIDKAGVPLKASELVFLSALALPILSLIGNALAGLVGAVLALPITFLLPPLLLSRLKKERERKLNEQLPDTLSLISGALKAGYSFMQAVDMTVAETSPPVSVEFKRVLTEARLGLPVEAALDNMARRVESESFDWAVMAIKIQREAGGNLSEILQTVADTIRERDRLSRHVKVLTAEGRLSAVVLCVLPFGIGALLWIINPSYLSPLFDRPIGLAMSGLAAILLAVGWIWLKKIATIEV